MEMVVNKPINPGEVYELIKKDSAGSVVLHYGVVRGETENKMMSSIEFQAKGDVERELHVVSEEIRRRWKIEDVLIIRRLGKLNVGDVIALVAVSCPHRKEAFAACRYGVDRLKKMSTISKKETFV